jgi:hypothetical protein
LLKWLPENDKSLFLSQAGYVISDPEQLESDLESKFCPYKPISSGVIVIVFVFGTTHIQLVF